jgi:putative addiction module component (TIGR02574 family)
MSPRAAELLAEAVKLSEEDRAELADQLLESIEPTGTELVHLTEEEFAAELERRHQEFLRDPSVGIPWEEVKRRGLRE